MQKLLLLIALIFIVPTKSHCQHKTREQQSKVLIVYLSRTNNTKVLAEIIHKNIGGTLVALELEKPYPENYQAIVKQVSEEYARGFLPPLKTKIENIEQYDTVFIGFPTWAMNLPPPIQSFLNENKFKGKILIPFNTNAGYGLGSSIDKIKEMCPEADLKPVFSMIGGKEKEGIFLTIKDEKAKDTERKVVSWLKSLKL
jgi:flavodoxin